MPRKPGPVIIVHGGAGAFPEDERGNAREGCCEAARAGWAILARGGSALDAVEAAVVVLENNPLFNAGTGATLNSLGHVELDASLMDGATLRAGAVAAVPPLRNPIHLARRILDDGRHVMLAGEGAMAFARSVGIEACDETDLIVPRQQRRWQEKHGTVGAVALDSRGHLAAATSTGGIFDKLPGRVGDSSVLGAGTWADDIAAVSCTGHGEAIMRTTLARATAGFLGLRATPHTAAARAIRFLHKKTESHAGLIVVDRRGRIGYARNTAHMPICWITKGEAVSED